MVHGYDGFFCISGLFLSWAKTIVRIFSSSSHKKKTHASKTKLTSSTQIGRNSSMCLSKWSTQVGIVLDRLAAGRTSPRNSFYGGHFFSLCLHDEVHLWAGQTWKGLTGNTWCLLGLIRLFCRFPWILSEKIYVSSDSDISWQSIQGFSTFIGGAGCQVPRFSFS